MMKLPCFLQRRVLPAVALVLLACWQSGAFTATFPETERLGARTIAMSRAERLVSDAIEYLEELPSFSADLDFETRLFGKRYYGHGRYEELSESRNLGAAARPPLERCRFLLRAAMATEDHSDSGSESDALDIVCDCDRRAWWRNDSSVEVSPLSQINIEDLKNSLSHLSDDENLRLAESGVQRSCGMNGMPGLGGVAGTLKRVASYYQFEPEYEEVFPTTRAASAEGARDSFLKVSGKARSRFWEKIRSNLGVGNGEIPDYIAENLPTRVEIYFRAVDDGTSRRRPFPCKIAYFVEFSDDEATERRPLFSVEYSAVVRNDPTISVEDFVYVQPQITFERLNAEYVRDLTEPPGSER